VIIRAMPVGEAIVIAVGAAMLVLPPFIRGEASGMEDANLVLVISGTLLAIGGVMLIGWRKGVIRIDDEDLVVDNRRGAQATVPRSAIRHLRFDRDDLFIGTDHAVIRIPGLGVSARGQELLIAQLQRRQSPPNSN
jgi:hypothetical protein